MLRDTRVRGLLDVAEAFTRNGRPLRAIVSYRRILALTQDGEFERELAHARLADLHLALGDAARALPHLRRAIVLSAGEPQYALMLGRALVELGRYEEAGPHLLEAAGWPLYAAEAMALTARCLEGQGERRAAADLARRAAERAPDEPAWRRLARDLADA
jgi:tetratricopeptide (TPR) repeat protein